MSEPVFHPLEAAQRQRRNLLRVVRMAFFILIVTVALVTVLQEASNPDFSRLGADGVSLVAYWIPVTLSLALFGVAMAIDLMTPNKKISTISGVFMGLLVGMLATVALSLVMDLALQVWLDEKALATNPVKAGVGMVKILTGICLSYLGITTVLQTQDDFRLVIPYVEFAKQIRGTKPLVLDTSALIDARIADVAATGLLQAPLVVPRFVIGELQLLADSSDKLKRARGRRGLDVVSRLQRQGTIDVTIDETPIVARAVDQMLVELAERLTGRLVTTDLGLTRVAQIQGVSVLNLHEIANAFKPALIPGEQVLIRLVKGGEQPGQGVGYLDDGTMVVAEGGASLIGRDVLLLVTSTLQTSAGRLVFARPLEGPGPLPPAAAVAQDAAPPAEGTEPVHEEPEAADGAAAALEGPDSAPDAPAAAVPTPNGGGGAVRKPGPFPPKPPARRPPSPRNPRR